MSALLRIVVVSDDRVRQASLVAALSSDHCCAIAIDYDRALVEIKQQPPDVVLLDVASAGAIEHVRRLSVSMPKSAYIVSVIAEPLPARTCVSAVAAGSHDVICEPYSSAELFARIEVHRRLRGWAAANIVGAPTAAKAPGSEVTSLRAWDYLGDIIADDLEGMFGQPVEISERWISLAEQIQFATIAMTLPSAQTELCISIVANPACRSWLGLTLLGDPAAPDEAIDDVMREIANMAGGALKRAALTEGPVLSTGIPVDGRSLPRRGSGARCWTISVGGQQLGVIGEVRRRANRRIPARRLLEGMIVVGDVRNQAGVLLLSSGTRLTSTTAQRLSNMLDSMEIDVSA